MTCLLLELLEVEEGKPANAYAIAGFRADTPLLPSQPSEQIVVLKNLSGHVFEKLFSDAPPIIAP